MNHFKVILVGAKDNSPRGMAILKANIVNHFGSNLATIEEMLASLPVVLEENLSEQEAVKLQQVFSKFGAIIQIQGPALTVVEVNKPNSTSSPELEFNLNDSPEQANVKKEAAGKTSAAQADSSLEFVLDDSLEAKRPQKTAAPSGANQDKFNVPELDFDIDYATDNQPLQIATKTPQKSDSDLSQQFSIKMPALAATTQPKVAKEPSSAAITAAKPANDAAFIAPVSNLAADNDSTPLSAVEEKPKPKNMYLLGSGVCSVLCLLFFFAALSGKEDTPTSSALNDPLLVSRLLQEQQAILKASAPTPVQANSNSPAGIKADEWWREEINIDNFEATISLASLKQNVVEADFKIKKSTPKKPTQNEFLKGINSIPWLDRLTILNPDSLAAESSKELSQIKIIMPCRAYVKEGIKAAIVYPNLEITGLRDKDTIKGRWRLFTPEANLAQNSVTALENGQYSINYGNDLNLTKSR
ncbi:MAG: hypothetical protein IT292_10390 [Deltaproteobacteria bacterium]|nr:hypothetical protein [Deltaproteobacteria bacterium]